MTLSSYDMPMRPISILFHDEGVPLGLLGEGLSQVSVREVRLNRGDDLPALDEVGAIISLGGHMGAYEETGHPFLGAEKAFLREAVAAAVPALGVCLGCQIMADALGGRAYRAPVEEAGFIDLRMTDEGRADPVLGVLTEPMPSWHGDTFDLPPGAVLLARSEAYPQAFRLGSALGVQFHPEVTPAILQKWIDRDPVALYRVGVDPARFVADLEERRDALQDEATRLVRAWLEEVRAAGR